MKNSILKIAGVISVLYILALIYISSNAQKQFDIYINSMNRLTPSIKSKVISFDGTLTGAKAKVQTSIDDPELKNRVNQILKLPIETDMRLKYGPLVYLADNIHLAVAGTQKSMKISSMIKDDALNQYKSVFPDDININLYSLISFSNKAKESMKIDIKKVLDNQEDLEFDLTPIKIDRDYDIYTLKGINKLHIDNLKIYELTNKELLGSLNNINSSFKLDAISKDGLVYGDYNIGAEQITINTEKQNQSIKFSSKSKISLKNSDKEYATLKIESKLKTLNPTAKTLAMGINSAKTVIQLHNLGQKGLEKLLTLQKRRIQNQRAMQIAAAKGDSKALGRALANIARLDNEFVPVLNHIFIKGKSQIDIDEEIQSDKKSHITLNATYMGEPLSGDIMNALVVLASRADRLFNAHLDIKLEKSLTQKLYPQASWILDSMVNKAMAKDENGFYILKADMKDGKIIINHTKYAPQELIMLILM